MLRMSDLKLAGASALLQTLSLVLFVVFGPTTGSVPTSEKKMIGMHELMLTVV